jgi:hypothetical protein
MIRFLVLASVLAACKYDATLGNRPDPNLNVADAAQPIADAAAHPDAPANFAFDYLAGGPLLYDGGYVYAIMNQYGSSVPEALVGFDPATGNRTDLAYIPVTAMAQDATTIYAIVLGSTPGLFDIFAIAKASTTRPNPDEPFDAAATFATSTIAHDLAGAKAIAVDADAIYVTESNSLVRMNKKGENATTLVTATGLSAVVLDSSFAYVVEDVPQGQLLAVPKTGGTALVLASQLVLPHDLDLAVGDVYVTEQGDGAGGAIGRVAAPAAGAQQADVAPFTRVVVGAHTPVDLTHDDTYVYWTADRDGLMRAPLAGGTPELRMPTSTAGNSAVAVENGYVLFAAPSGTGDVTVHAVVR